MLYVTGGLIVVMAAYSAVSMEAVSQSTDLVFRERLIAARAIAGEIDGNFSHLQSELDEAAQNVGAALAVQQENQVQDTIHTLRQHWLNYDRFGNPCIITLTDPNGMVLWSDPPDSGAIPDNLSSLPSFQATLLSQESSITDEVASGAGTHGVLSLVTPIRVAGQIRGYLVGDINLSGFSQHIAPTLDMGKASYGITVINESGIVIASTESERQWSLSDHFQLIKDQLAHKQAVTVTHQMPSGSAEPTHIIAFVPLSMAPWGVIVEEPQDIAFALPHALENRLLLFGVVVLLAGLLLAWVTTRAVVKPVNALIDASQSIAAGNLDLPLDLIAEDEVGRLARSFDEMRTELKQSREEIAHWNRELEARVRQRTLELTALVKSSQALITTLDIDRLFEILIRETLEVVPSAEGIAFFLFDHAQKLLRVRSTYGFDVAECTQLGYHIGEGIAGRVFEAPTPVRLNLVEEIRIAQSNLSVENEACFRRAIGGRAVKSILGTPLVSKGARLGALVLYNFSDENVFTDNDITVLQAFANQAAAAIENARLYASLQEKEAARAALLEQVIQAQEEERARVAREIHDELGQLLTRLSIDLKMCETQIAAEPNQAAQTLAATQKLVWQTLEQAHQLIVELRPTLLDELGLEAALREELATRLGPLGVTTKLEADHMPERLPASVEITIFRIAQEAISNIARHARAQHAALSLRVADALQVFIEDDGIGIQGDWRSDANGHRPLGLLGMQERAALIGGTLMIEPIQPHGTRVTLYVPLEKFLSKEKSY